MVSITPYQFPPVVIMPAESQVPDWRKSKPTTAGSDFLQRPNLRGNLFLKYKGMISSAQTSHTHKYKSCLMVQTEVFPHTRCWRTNINTAPLFDCVSAAPSLLHLSDMVEPARSCLPPACGSKGSFKALTTTRKQSEEIKKGGSLG